MGSYYAKQPNGLYCRFSTIVDCPTMINMSLEDIENELMREAIERIHYDMISIEKHPYTMKQVSRDYLSENGNMSIENFESLLQKVEKPIDNDTKMEYT